MKKIIMLLLLLALVGLVGCGDEKGDGDDSVLTVAVSPDYPPYEFINDVNATGVEKYAGADIEFAKYVAEKLGMEIEFKEITFEACPAAVNSNKVDVAISGFSWLPSREENFALSSSYFDEGDGKQKVLVSSTSSFQTLADINKAGIKVGAQSGSLQDELVDEFLPNCDKQSFTDIDMAVALLNQGKMDAIVISEHSANVYTQTIPTLKVLAEELDVPKAGYVVVAKLDNQQLIDQINEIIVEVIEKGLYAQWVEEAIEIATASGLN